MKKFKKALSLLTALIMAVSVINVSGIEAFAEETFTGIVATPEQGLKVGAATVEPNKKVATLKATKASGDVSEEVEFSLTGTGTDNSKFKIENKNELKVNGTKLTQTDYNLTVTATFAGYTTAEFPVTLNVAPPAVIEESNIIQLDFGKELESIRMPGIGGNKEEIKNEGLSVSGIEGVEITELISEGTKVTIKLNKKIDKKSALTLTYNPIEEYLIRYKDTKFEGKIDYTGVIENSDNKHDKYLADLVLNFDEKIAPIQTNEKMFDIASEGVTIKLITVPERGSKQLVIKLESKTKAFVNDSRIKVKYAPTQSDFVIRKYGEKISAFQIESVKIGEEASDVNVVPAPKADNSSRGFSGGRSSVRPNTPERKSDDKKDIKPGNELPPIKPDSKVSTKLTIGEMKYTVVVDGMVVERTMDVAPMVHMGRTVLPARMISEILGVEVKYEPATRTANFMYGEEKVQLTLGQKFMLVNGKSMPLTADILNVNGRILLPLTDIQKAFAELGLKAKVDWDADTKSVTVDK